MNSKLVVFAYAALLSGCDGALPSRNSQASVPDYGAGTVNAESVPDLSGNKTVAAPTASVDTSPRITPATEVAALMHVEEAENDACRGGSGDEPDTLRACNRRQVMLYELHKRGWCWGGAEISADEHWVKCSADPTNRLEDFEGPAYSEDDIQGARQTAQ